jgi:hypothetical protein
VAQQADSILKRCDSETGSTGDRLHLALNARISPPCLFGFIQVQKASILGDMASAMHHLAVSAGGRDNSRADGAARFCRERPTIVNAIHRCSFHYHRNLDS